MLGSGHKSRAAIAAAASIASGAGAEAPAAAPDSGRADPVRVQVTVDQVLDAAARHLASGAYDDADRLLAVAAAGDPERVDMLRVGYLAARIASGRGDHARAAEILERVVARDDTLYGARLALAEAYAEGGKHREAARAYRRLARAEEASPTVRTVAQDRAAVAERARVFRTQLGAALAPSTNVNSGTSAEEFLVFGEIPALLDEESQRRSGVGINWNAGVTARPVLTSRLRGIASVTGRLRDYEGADFDDAEARGAFGVELEREAAAEGLAGLRARLLVSAYQRRFGGSPFLSGREASLSMSGQPTRRLRAGGTLSVSLLDYADREDRDGALYRASLWANRDLTPKTRAGLSVSVAREEAKATTLSASSASLGANVTRLLPGKLVATASGSAGLRRFDEASAFYGVLREDVTLSGALAASKADWTIGGFTPSVSYGYTLNRSSVSLFGFDRHEVRMGMEAAF